MVVVMNLHATKEQVEAVNCRLAEMGFQPHVITGVNRIVIGAVGNKRDNILAMGLESIPGVEKIVPIMKPFKLVSREVKEEGSVVKVKNAAFGGSEFTVIAGPCAVESEEQVHKAAEKAAAAGAKVLRGGAFKPRTSPYSFQGLEELGLKYLADAAARNNLACVTEIIDLHSLEKALKYVDMVQVGARNMQNFQLLREVGRCGKPVLLKRGLSATVEEWLLAAEYVYSEGNENIILCERGIRTFETSTRNTLDISAVPLVKEMSHLPVIVDPSHATGKRSLVAPMSMAAAASGADGIMVEMHPEPSKALCDGKQSLSPDEFVSMMRTLRSAAQAAGKALAGGEVVAAV